MQNARPIQNQPDKYKILFWFWLTINTIEMMRVLDVI